MTPFAYATPHSNAPYIERARSSIGIYEDDDEIDDKIGVNIDDCGSTTDDLYAEEETGYEANALSDYNSDVGVDYGHARQVDEEWEGVQDEIDLEREGVGYESRAIGKVIPGGLGEDRDVGGDGDGDGDDQSEVSSVPSEYPSRQPEGLFDLHGGKPGFRIHIDEEVEV